MDNRLHTEDVVMDNRLLDLDKGCKEIEMNLQTMLEYLSMHEAVSVVYSTKLYLKLQLYAFPTSNSRYKTSFRSWLSIKKSHNIILRAQRT